MLCIFLIFQAATGEQYKEKGLMDKLSSGMKFAQDFLGKFCIFYIYNFTCK